MSISVAFQTLVVDTLKANAAVAARVGANIFDSVPTKRPYPCIQLGASDFSPEYGEGLVARTESLQIDVWHRDQGRLNPCKATVDAVYTALHDVDLALPDPYALVRVHVSLVRVFRDADGISAHGVVQVEADLETH